LIVVVPCRTKSARLPQKALIPIHGVPGIERCLLNALAIERSSAVVLATSGNPEDDALEQCTVDGRADFVRGSEDDVLQRFFVAVDRHDAQYAIRATGDCPAVSYEMADALIQSHFESGADVTYPVGDYVVGVNCEVYTVAALRRLRELMPHTLHSEYLPYYFRHNPSNFHLNPVELPEFSGRGWRLTVDEQSDLDLFERLYSTLDIGRRPIAWREIVSFFEAHPEAAELNSTNHLRYVHDQDFVSFLQRVTTFPAAS
jgi:spore coat polysaccharide biosynthesis protein SpsF (cytidylyltransferase family)